MNPNMPVDHQDEMENSLEDGEENYCLKCGKQCEGNYCESCKKEFNRHD